MSGYIYEFGTGKDTVLVLHGGFGAEHSYMLAALRPLEKQYHFVLYDQRGSLRSPCPDSLLNVEAMIDDIEAIRKELHIQKLTILAHSMGSWQASYYLQKHPDHVKRLVLCGLFQIRNFDNPLYQAWYKKTNDEFNSFFKRPAY
jgi:pimeloyl-ACP methyl ester carboxylesterase